jgi:putative membrane protein insertion efficiency factor
MLTRLLIAPIRWYQRYLSPLKRVPSCRYLPTCSQYAIEAVQTRGAMVGLALALWRLARCNPLFHAGYDPVPPCRDHGPAVDGHLGAPAKRHS